MTCGTQYPDSEQPPRNCPICDDPRQYVGFDGQTWTTLEALRAQHANEFSETEVNLTAIETKPSFAIGQRAFLVQSPGGNVLWDCIALIDDATRAAVHQKGGLAAIAISHPHYYTTMIEWSHAFGNIPIYLHEYDRHWVMRPDPVIQFWSGERLALHDDMTLIRAGGHFDGGSLLHWPRGAEGRGVLFCGDVIQVVPDRRWVSFMYSYPNLIPLDAKAVRKVTASVDDFEFDRIHGAFHPRSVMGDGRAAFARSAQRYLRAIGVLE